MTTDEEPNRAALDEQLGAALDCWEAEDGPFTDDELEDAARALRAAGALG